MKRKPGILANIFFVVFVGTWIALAKRSMGPDAVGQYSLGQIVLGALGGALFGVVGLGLGLWLESKKDNGSVK